MIAAVMLFFPADVATAQRRLPEWAMRSWQVRRAVEPAWILTSVNVVDVTDGSIVRGVSIVIKGDLIQTISNEAAPSGSNIIDGKGGYVVPGFFDLHAHVIEPSPRFGTTATPEDTLLTLLRSGVTTIRLLPLVSEPAHVWCARVNHHDIPGPTIVPASGVFEKTPGRTTFPFGDPETARAWVRKEAMLGTRWIKIYDNMDEESLTAIVHTAAEHGMRVCGHASHVPPHRVSEIGMQCIEHFTGIPHSCTRADIDEPEFESRFEEIGWRWANLDEAAADALIDTLVQNRTAWVPTLVVGRRIVEIGAHDDSQLSDESIANLRAALDRAASLAVSMHRRGGLVGLGTDFPIDGVTPGDSVHEEMRMLVEHGGATPLEALQIATKSSAAILGHEAILGTIAPGRIANLVLLRDNPLEDIGATRTIEMVIHDGRMITGTDEARDADDAD